MADEISWKQVIEESHKVFFRDRPDDDWAAVAAVSRFERNILQRNLSAEEALAVLKQGEAIAAFLHRADIAAGERRQSIEHTQKLTNLQESSTRMEASLARLDATATKLEATSNGIDVRTTDIVNIIKNAIMQKLDEAVKHAFIAAENTALKGAIKAAVITSAISTVVFGIPSNLGTSYLYDRSLSVDAQKRLAEKKAKDSSGSDSPPTERQDSEQTDSQQTGSTIPSKSPPSAVPIEQGIYRLIDPITGKSAMEILEAGGKISIPTKSGEKCLSLSFPSADKPIVKQQIPSSEKDEKASVVIDKKKHKKPKRTGTANPSRWNRKHSAGLHIVP